MHINYMTMWNKLNMKDKSAIMRLAVQNGYRDLDSIVKAYNTFAEGGDASPGRSRAGTYWEHKPDDVNMVTGNVTTSIPRNTLLRDIYYDKEGNVWNKNTGERIYLSTPEVVVTPTRESYIQQKAEQYAQGALNRMLSTNVPVATIHDAVIPSTVPDPTLDRHDYHTPNHPNAYDREVLAHNAEINSQLHKDVTKQTGETCISTATYPFGKDSWEVYNPSFAKNYVQKGFAKVLDHSQTPKNVVNDPILDKGNIITRGNFELARDAKPGDIYQLWSKYGESHPFHAGMISDVGDNTVTMNQSHGRYEDTDNKSYALYMDENGEPMGSDNYPLETPYTLYRFVGTPKQQEQWGNFYDDFAWHNKKAYGGGLKSPFSHAPIPSVRY